MAHILLPTDFSKPAFTAARFAFDVLGRAGNTFTLVHTYLEPPGQHHLLPRLGVDVQSTAIRRMQAWERKIRRYAGKVHLRKITDGGALIDTLNAIHAERPVDMIVMGTQGENDHGLVGHNTVSVLRHVHVPMIAVPSEWTVRPIKRVMLAYDGPPKHPFSFDPLLDLLRQQKADLILAHVRNGPVGDTDTVLKTMLHEQFSSIPHSFITVFGTSLTSTLSRLAHDGDIDLVALVHRDRTFWPAIFHTSSAKRMALHAGTPVLVLHDKP